MITTANLAIEVCHDLVNRAMRNEHDAMPDPAFAKLCRDQEAAIRHILSEVTRLQAENERLTQERDEALTVIERGSGTDQKLRAARADLTAEVGHLTARVEDAERQRDARAAQVEEMLEQRRQLTADRDHWRNLAQEWRMELDAVYERIDSCLPIGPGWGNVLARISSAGTEIGRLRSALTEERRRLADHAAAREAERQQLDAICSRTIADNNALRSELARYTANRETGFQGRGE